MYVHAFGRIGTLTLLTLPDMWTQNVLNEVVVLNPGDSS